MDKEQANFVASTNSPASTTMTQLWEMVRTKFGTAQQDQVTNLRDYMEATSWKAIQAGETNGERRFILIGATFYYDPDILVSGDPESCEMCIVIHERYSSDREFWVISQPCDDSAFSEPNNAPFPNVDLLLKIISGEVKKVSGNEGHWTFKMHEGV